MKMVTAIGSSGFDPWTGRERTAAKYPSAVPTAVKINILPATAATLTTGLDSG